MRLQSCYEELHTVAGAELAAIDAMPGEYRLPASDAPVVALRGIAAN